MIKIDLGPRRSLLAPDPESTPCIAFPALPSLSPDEARRLESQERGMEIRRQLVARLQERGLLTDEGARRARWMFYRIGRSLWEVLDRISALAEPEVAETFAQVTGFPRWDPDAGPSVREEAAKLVPVGLCRRYGLVPIQIVGEQLEVAMADPSMTTAVDATEMMTSRTVRVRVATRSDVYRALDQTQGLMGDMSLVIPDDLLAPLVGPDPSVRAADRTPGVHIIDEFSENEAPTIRLVNLILTKALSSQVTEILLQPMEYELRVMFREHRRLRPEMCVPKKAEAAILSRIKIMACMDANRQRKSQTGAIRLVVDGQLTPSLLVRSVPTIGGEVIQITWVRSDLVHRGLDELGFELAARDVFLQALRRPGLILLVGGPGSGRTTLLYATLLGLVAEGIHAVLVGQDMAYILPGLRQVEYRSADRQVEAILAARAHDPRLLALDRLDRCDVARQAVEAAREGRTVLAVAEGQTPLAPLKGPDWPVELTRDLQAALSTTIRPALVRVLCTRCRRPEPAPEEWRRRIQVGIALARRVGLGDLTTGLPPVHRPVGCESCQKTGWSGRSALYEVLTASALTRIEATSTAGSEVRGECPGGAEEGLLTLEELAIRYALLGRTSPDEAERIARWDED